MKVNFTLPDVEYFLDEILVIELQQEEAGNITRKVARLSHPLKSTLTTQAVVASGATGVAAVSGTTSKVPPPWATNEASRAKGKQWRRRQLLKRFQPQRR